MSKIKPINILLYAFSIVLVGTMIVFADLELAPIDVLQDWKITVPTSKTYYPGSTIYLASKYKKVRQVTGTATRYIQCKKQGTNEWDGFIPVSQADATRPKTNAGDSITYIGIPSSLPTLPNTCRIYINVNYRINYLRSFVEQNYSNEFIVHPTPQQAQNGITLMTPPSINKGLSPQLSPSPNTAATNSGDALPLIQSNNPTPIAEDAPATVNNSLLTAPIRGVTDTINGVVNGLKTLSGL